MEIIKEFNGELFTQRLKEITNAPTNEALADMIDLDRTQLSKMKSSNGAPQLATILRIYNNLTNKGYKVSLDYILGLIDENPYEENESGYFDLIEIIRKMMIENLKRAEHNRKILNDEIDDEIVYVNNPAITFVGVKNLNGDNFKVLPDIYYPIIYFEFYPILTYLFEEYNRKCNAFFELNTPFEDRIKKINELVDTFKKRYSPESLKNRDFEDLVKDITYKIYSKDSICDLEKIYPEEMENYKLFGKSKILPFE